MLLSPADLTTTARSWWVYASRWDPILTGFRALLPVSIEEVTRCAIYRTTCLWHSLILIIQLLHPFKKPTRRRSQRKHGDTGRIYEAWKTKAVTPWPESYKHLHGNAFHMEGATTCPGSPQRMRLSLTWSLAKGNFDRPQCLPIQVALCKCLILNDEVLNWKLWIFAGFHSSTDRVKRIRMFWITWTSSSPECSHSNSFLRS